MQKWFDFQCARFSLGWKDTVSSYRPNRANLGKKAIKLMIAGVLYWFFFPEEFPPFYFGLLFIGISFVSVAFGELLWNVLIAPVRIFADQKNELLGWDRLVNGNEGVDVDVTWRCYRRIVNGVLAIGFCITNNEQVQYTSGGGYLMIFKSSNGLVNELNDHPQLLWETGSSKRNFEPGDSWMLELARMDADGNSFRLMIAPDVEPFFAGRYDFALVIRGKRRTVDAKSIPIQGHLIFEKSLRIELDNWKEREVKNE